LYLEGGIVDDGNGGGASGASGNDVYKGRVEPVLVSLSNPYSNNEISICDSGPSSCSAYTFYCLLLF